MKRAAGRRRGKGGNPMDASVFLKALPVNLSYLYSTSASWSGTKPLSVVRCLEFNLVASGADPHDAEVRMDRLVLCYIFHAYTTENLAAITRRAANPYWAIFWENSPRSDGHLLVELSPDKRKLLARAAAETATDKVSEKVIIC